MHTQSDVFFFVHHANIKKNDKNKINKHKEYSKAGTPFAWVKRLNKQRAEQNKQGPACFISGGTLFYEFAGFCNLLQTGFLISKCAVEHRNTHFSIAQTGVTQREAGRSQQAGNHVGTINRRIDLAAININL